MEIDNFYSYFCRENGFSKNIAYFLYLNNFSLDYLKYFLKLNFEPCEIACLAKKNAEINDVRQLIQLKFDNMYILSYYLFSNSYIIDNFSIIFDDDKNLYRKLISDEHFSHTQIKCLIKLSINYSDITNLVKIGLTYDEIFVLAMNNIKLKDVIQAYCLGRENGNKYLIEDLSIFVN